MICMVFMFCLMTAVASPAQTFTNLLTFNFTDGSNPEAALVQGIDGNFYGTTTPYGGGPKCDNNCGTVFRITRAGKLTTLHFFEGTDGSFPVGLVPPITESSTGQLSKVGPPSVRTTASAAAAQFSK